jgi:hypothetical protein
MHEFALDPRTEGRDATAERNPTLGAPKRPPGNPATPCRSHPPRCWRTSSRSYMLRVQTYKESNTVGSSRVTLSRSPAHTNGQSCYNVDKEETECAQRLRAEGTPPTGKSEGAARSLELRQKKTGWGESTRWKGVRDAGNWDAALYSPRDWLAVRWVSADGVSFVFEAVRRKTELSPPQRTLRAEVWRQGNHLVTVLRWQSPGLTLRPQRNTQGMQVPL